MLLYPPLVPVDKRRFCDGLNEQNAVETARVTSEAIGDILTPSVPSPLLRVPGHTVRTPSTPSRPE